MDHPKDQPLCLGSYTSYQTPVKTSVDKQNNPVILRILVFLSSFSLVDKQNHSWRPFIAPPSSHRGRKTRLDLRFHLENSTSSAVLIHDDVFEVLIPDRICQPGPQPVWVHWLMCSSFQQKASMPSRRCCLKPNDYILPCFLVLSELLVVLFFFPKTIEGVGFLVVNTKHLPFKTIHGSSWILWAIYHTWWFWSSDTSGEAGWSNQGVVFLRYLPRSRQHSLSHHVNII